MQRERTGQSALIPAQTAQPSHGITIIGERSSGKHYTQGGRRIKGEEIRSGLPVSGFIDSIEKNEQSASIGKRTAQVVSQQATPDLFAAIGVAGHFVAVQRGKT